VLLEDDLGWVFSDVAKKTVFAFESFFKDYFYKSEAEFNFDKIKLIKILLFI
jgi:hypothetical protein